MRRARFEMARALPPSTLVVTDAVPSHPSFLTLWVEYNKLVVRSLGALLGI